MRILIVLATIGAALAAPSNAGQRVVGGTETDILQYPFMASMQFGLLGGLLWQQRCGGSILTPNMIMSCAHCYHQTNVNLWRVRLGSSFSDHDGYLFDVLSFTMHEEYNDRTMQNDMALVRLASPAAYSPAIQPARIPGPSYVVSDGAVLTTIGWGSLIEGGESSVQLQSAQVASINRVSCAQRYAELKTQPGFANWPEVQSSMMCAGSPNGGKDSCTGDNGGPVTQAGDIVVGMTSWGYGCGRPDYPGVKTLVSSFSNWVVANSV